MGKCGEDFEELGSPVTWACEKDLQQCWIHQGSAGYGTSTKTSARGRARRPDRSELSHPSIENSYRSAGKRYLRILEGGG